MMWRWQKSTTLGLAVAAGVVVSSRPSFGRDSIDLIAELQCSQLIARDVNGDCVISEIDAVIAAMQALLSNAPSDLDGDGVITASDSIARLAILIDASFADLNQDRVIEASDAVAAIHAINGPDLTKDVDLDGVVDGADLIIVLERQGAGVGVDTAAIAQHMYTLIGLAQQYDADMLGGSCRASEHFEGVSSSYPSSHAIGWSPWYPANHMWTITAQWPHLPANHNFTLTQSSGQHIINFSHLTWPASHVYAVSTSWQAHNTATSTTTHTVNTSEMWRSAPSHSAAKSLTWPSSHDHLISRTYSPDHLGQLSAQRIPTPHDATTTSAWGHDESVSSVRHGVAFSALWPANHQVSISPTWPGPHHGQVSSSWPSNHLRVASATWPSGWPQWPPNHFASVSHSWGAPMDPGPSGWPAFPRNHSWWQTALDIAPLLR